MVKMKTDIFGAVQWSHREGRSPTSDRQMPTRSGLNLEHFKFFIILENVKVAGIQPADPAMQFKKKGEARSVF